MRDDSETGKTESRDVAVLASISELLEAPGPGPVHFAGPGESAGDAILPVLLEIGCEEIPARFLVDAERQLGERLEKALVEAHLVRQEAGAVAIAPTEPGKRQRRVTKPPDKSRLKTFSTPRRLIAHVGSLLEKQPDQTEEVVGPPVKVAFDAEGKPTRAAESFASRNGVEVKDLLQVETAKGLYLAAKKTTIGRAAVEVLADLLPKVIGAMTFPKSMVWEEAGVRFVRPIRWIVAVIGEGDKSKIIPFEVAGVKSGNITRSHRLARKPQVAVTGFKDYTNKLRRGHVEIDPERRRRRVRQQIQKLLASDAPEPVSSLGPEASPPAPNADVSAPIPENRAPVSSLVPDADLEGWVVASTEWPQPILGSFEERFLELPREILITVMRDHQKYFALEPARSEGEPAAGPEWRTGALTPSFVTVLNVPGDPHGIIRRGHERVLTARLEDAGFFWHADQKIPLRDRVALLERVTYHDKLGSYADKIRRASSIAEFICAELESANQVNPGQKEYALRAVELCKCDLTTQMVQEFTEIQGIVGGLYAKAQGEPEEVWQAIYDHYKPVNLDDRCPRSAVGAVVSLADKLDAVIGGFSVGLEPTGSSDPFGLRRAGNGIVKIATEALPGLDLYNLASRAHREIEPILSSQVAGGWKQIESFLSERLAFYLEAVAGLKYDTIRAVLSPEVSHSWNVPSRVLERAQALESARKSVDFQALAAAAKRTRNILTKSAKPEDFGARMPVTLELLRSQEERELYFASEAARAELAVLESGSDYKAAFHRLGKLRPAVDQFFDKVMVMDPDLALRANRLRLLSDLDTLAFRRFADLSELEAGAAPDS